MFKKAYKDHYAIGAFNVNNMEIIQGIMEAAKEEESPVILQASEGARNYAGQEYIVGLVKIALQDYPEIPTALHLDHGSSYEICKACIDGGFSSVMYDGSKHPFEENVKVTKQIVEYAHDKGVVVEAELGRLAGVEDMVSVDAKDAIFTDPDQAAEFVERTGCDSLAIAIGTSHGAYKFTRKPTGDILAISRVQAINARIPNTHLVMHGSSSVPQELLAIINQYGGKMKETYGVPVEEIQKAIQFGVRKVNIDTDIRLAMTGAVRKFLAENPDKFDAREWLKPAREAAKAICKQRYIEFGCEGQGAKIKGHNLQVMASRYAAGELAQVVN